MSGYEQVSNTKAMAANTSGSVSVSCTAGKKLLGVAGYWSSSNAAVQVVMASTSTATAWHTTGILRRRHHARPGGLRQRHPTAGPIGSLPRPDLAAPGRAAGVTDAGSRPCPTPGRKRVRTRAPHGRVRRVSRPYARPHALRAALVLPAVVPLGTALVGCGATTSEGVGSDPPTTAGSTGAGLEVSDGISPTTSSAAWPTPACRPN